MVRTLIIIVTYNGLNHIKECLRNSFKSSEEVDFIIIDNASSDDTLNFIKENYPSIKIIENKKNLGFGAANNIGLRYALKQRYDYVYLLNQDAWIKTESIKELIIIAEKNKDFGIISPLQVYAGEKKIDHNFSSKVTEEMKNDYIINPENKKEIYRVTKNTIQAAHWLLRVSAIRRVGGFSPIFFHYGEDTNFCQRMEFHGYKLGVIPAILGIHNRENRINPRSFYVLLSINEWKETVSNPNLTGKMAIKLLSVKMIKTFLDYPGKFLPAFFKFIKDLPDIIKKRQISIYSEFPFLE